MPQHQQLGLIRSIPAEQEHQQREEVAVNVFPGPT
jgi:hypothetical protein